MIKIEFTPEEIDALKLERYHHPDPEVQKKMEALCLKSQQLAPQEICWLCRISEPTPVAYLKHYQAGGIEQLKKRGYSAAAPWRISEAGIKVFGHGCARSFVRNTRRPQGHVNSLLQQQSGDGPSERITLRKSSVASSDWSQLKTLA